MFRRCETWLTELQLTNWVDMVWGRTANYIVQQRVENQDPAPVVGAVASAIVGNGDVSMVAATAVEDEGMADDDAPGDLEQFQWP
jgi:hypothetical protein